MILVDFAHLCNRYVFATCATIKPKKQDGKFITKEYQNFFIHGILTNLNFIKKEFEKSFGEVVICLEGKSWRKDAYPDYKAQRSVKKEKSEVNWDEIYEVINDLAEALRNYFGIKVISSQRAEADDIIAVVCKNYPGSHLIISSDKDFKQLLLLDNVKQYDPMKKVMKNFTKEEILEDLELHIIKGDDVDNIKSIAYKEKFSPEFTQYLRENNIFTKNPKEFFSLECSKDLVEKYDVFEKYASGKLKGQNKETKSIFKKAIMTKQKVDSLRNFLKDSKNADSWIMEQYKLNQSLIDFNYIPKDVVDEIIFDIKNNRKQDAKPLEMMTFCSKYQLKEFVKNIQAFHNYKAEAIAEW